MLHYKFIAASPKPGRELVLFDSPSSIKLFCRMKPMRVGGRRGGGGHEGKNPVMNVVNCNVTSPRGTVTSSTPTQESV